MRMTSRYDVRNNLQNNKDILYFHKYINSVKDELVSCCINNIFTKLCKFF